MAARCTCPECNLTFQPPPSAADVVPCPICDTPVPVPAVAPKPAAPIRRPAPVIPAAVAPVYAVPVAPPPTFAAPAQPSSRRQWVVGLLAVFALCWLLGGAALGIYYFAGNRAAQVAETRPAVAQRRTTPVPVVETSPGGPLLPGPDDDPGDEWTRKLRLMRERGLDLVICFDSTGSMGGEIQQLKAKISRIGKTLLELVPSARISICTYRDLDDEYVVKGLPLTNDIDAIEKYLRPITAEGGGDDPEAVQEGLRWSVEKNQFRPGAVKVILLFGDAPPHKPDVGTCLKIARDFREKQGGIVSTVTCRTRKIPEFVKIAEAGGGEAFEVKDHKQIVEQLVILVFGSAHREKVIEAFRLLDR